MEVSAPGQTTGDYGAKEKRNLEWSRLFTGSCSAEVQSKMREIIRIPELCDWPDVLGFLYHENYLGIDI